ncbi:DUF6879 family protein [Streptomyces lichenis]|uniref:DUF6879 domain-containing protein n=1 Tax=Streptomyces lichenis TaxID=2306967 RepID=A0ABT0I5H1_9ACTN|nr:DUF6879 family protein [Streptomyces lichenis]MCK8676569.1 hypothetical protein [Streptomyces lichenis]
MTVVDAVPASGMLEFFESGFRHSAWRLETRRSYTADEATEEYQQFLRGIDPPRDVDGPWFVNARERTAQGVRIERVRLVDEPPSDGQRYLLATTPDNLAAGEDIRFLTRTRAQGLELPDFDFWLFDSSILARFNWTNAERRLEMDTDPAAIAAACRARDLAWQHAVPYAEFTG